MALPRERLLPSLLIGQAGVAGVLLLHLLGWLQPLDLFLYDHGLRLRAQPRVNERIVLVRVEEEDLGDLGWPLADGALARILTILTAARPAAVGVDIYRDRPVGDGREDLDRVLRENTDIIWIDRFPGETTRAVPAPAVLAGTDQVGFSDLLVDPDGTVRRGLLFLSAPDGTPGISFALASALRFLGRHGIVPAPDPQRPEHLRLGAATLVPLEASDGAYVGADQRGYQFFLDYALGPGAAVSVSVRDVLDGRVPAAALAGRLVFVAVTADSVKDHFRTPVDPGFAFGVEIHGQAAGQLVRMALGESPPPRTVPDAAEIASVLAVGAAATLAGLTMRGPAGFAVLMPGGAALAAALWYALLLRGVWVPLAAPLAAWVTALGLVTAYLSWRERADREALMRLFASHVAGPVARDLWERRDAFMDGGRPRPQRLTATVLFADIAGFTPISEKLDPEALDAWLHVYMGAMVPVILDHGGLVLRFVGDAILAVFGVPIARTTEEEIDRDAVQAARSALAMGRALEPLNERWRADGLPPVSIRVGLFTGDMVAGSIGGPGHMEYSLTGDAVNTAARLEALAKTMGTDMRGGPCRILAGEPTWQRLHGVFDGAPVGQVALKGKDRTVVVHAILGERVAHDPDSHTTGAVARLTARSGRSDQPSTRVEPSVGQTRKGMRG